ncbi:hypothetical protein ACX0G9_03745 [Flavitalea flava]
MNKSINKLNKDSNGIILNKETGETGGIVSKTILSLLLAISIVVTGLASYHLFRESDYNASALLTLASYFSIVLCIYALSMIKNKPAIK